MHSSDYVRDGIPIITTEHFKNGEIQRNVENIPKVSLIDFKRLSQYTLKENDIVFSRVGSVDINALVTKKEVGWLFSGRVIRVRAHNVSSSYLHYLLSTKKVRDNIKARAVGQTMPSINSDILNATAFKISSSPEEQIKIANFLSVLDKRIYVQNKIIEDMISLKKGIKSRIFSSQKANYKIGDFIVEYTEKNRENFEPVSVGKYGIRKRSDLFSRELSKDYSKNKVIHKNSLVIGMGTKEIDMATLLEDKNYCVSPAYTTYKIQNINSYYFNELLDNFNRILSLRYMITGARQGKSVNKKDLLKHPIYTHSQDDQNKIISLLKSLDYKTQIESNLLKQYNLQKQYFLNNLFI